jgi:isopentenyl diphosphate isomerase/L-lactate dehydrogenase-like FMN-dependent dehydrogenase
MNPMDIKKLKGYLQNNRSDIKIIVKGIMCVEDAMMALELGADAIYVSNGSHMKAWSAPSTINVLKNISLAVKSK